MNDKFVTKLVIGTESKEYSHGYNEEDVKKLTLAKELVDKRDLIDFPVTLDEFKSVIVPYLRIQRTEAFNINTEIVKVKSVKPPKPPSAAALKKRYKTIQKYILDEIEVNEEDMEFYTNYTTQESLL